MAAADAPDQFQICTQACGARCCRYITVEIPAPRSHDDWDEMRWWLAHEGVLVSKNEDGWLLHVETRCANLRPDNACRIHPHHMDTCKDHDAAVCEFTGPLDQEFELHHERDLARYLERRGLKRGRAVARAIRRAARHRDETPAVPLVPLRGLSGGDRA